MDTQKKTQTNKLTKKKIQENERTEQANEGRRLTRIRKRGEIHEHEDEERKENKGKYQEIHEAKKRSVKEKLEKENDGGVQ